MPTIPIRNRKSITRRKPCRLPAQIIPGKDVPPATSWLRVENLAEAIDIEGGAAVRVRDAGDAAIVGGGVAIADDVDIADEIEGVDAVAVDFRDLIVGAAGRVEGCLGRGYRNCFGGAEVGV